MTEAETIELVDEPVTTSSIAANLRALDIGAGDMLLVHASLSALGWVCGGAPAVVDALQSVLTESGTLVMPTHSTQYSDPAGWENPPVPDDWVPRIREARPPYRPTVTPTRGMGAIAECFRNYSSVSRSRHPEFSFAAGGAEADAVVADHAFDYGLGESSPLATVYELDGTILLLGVGYDRNTSLHLAEHRADLPTETVRNRVPVADGAEVREVEYVDIELDSTDFKALGADFEREAEPVEGTVGAAEATVIHQPTLVDFAVDWLEENR